MTEIKACAGIVRQSSPNRKLLEGKSMTEGEMLFLALVLGATTIFALVLGYVVVRQK